MQEAEIEKIYTLILNDKYYSDPNFENNMGYDYSLIINIPHNLDLIRCYQETELHQEVIDDARLNKKPSKEKIKELLDYARALIVATGDCVTHYEGSAKHNPFIFHACSTNVSFCLEKIFSVDYQTAARNTDKNDLQELTHTFLPGFDGKSSSLHHADPNNNAQAKKRKIVR